MAKKKSPRSINRYFFFIIFFAVGLIAGLTLTKSLIVLNSNSLTMQIASIKEDSKFFSINAELPQIKKAPKSFNRSVSAFVTNSISQFKKDSSENWATREESNPPGTPKEEYPDSPFVFVGTWEPAQLNSDTLSFIVRLSYFSGGASSQDSLQTFNYNLKGKKEIKLSDLFPDDSDYLKKLSVISRNSLSSSLSQASSGNVDSQILDEGTEPTEENFSQFIFNGTTITLIFPRYQVAPGVFGEQQVMIPQDKASFESLYLESL